MSLTPCPICKKPISSNAKTCPNCGETDPSQGREDGLRYLDKLRRDKGEPRQIVDSEEVNNLIHDLMRQKKFWRAMMTDSNRFGLKLIHSQQRIQRKAYQMGLSTEFDLYLKKNIRMNKIGCMIFIPILLLFLIYWFVLGGYKNI